MTLPSIAIAMIVKNEAHVIARALQSVKPYIDCWAICDTGSTDDTVEIIERELGDVRGELRVRPWVNFAYNRNESIELARSLGAEYVLIIDADETLSVEPGALEALGREIYAIKCRMPHAEGVWLSKRLFRADVPWQYRGVLHEELHCGDESIVAQFMPGIEIASHHDSARNQLGKTEKYKRDAEVLKAEIERNPADTRAWFYLAQSLANAGYIDEAITAYYKRIELGGSFEQELFTALYQRACLMDLREDPADQVSAAYLKAYQFRPCRAEPLWALAVLHNNRGEHALAEIYARSACRIPRPDDGSLVQESVYEWRAADELANALAQLGRLFEAKQILQRIAAVPRLPEHELERIQENLGLLDKAAA